MAPRRPGHLAPNGSNLLTQTFERGHMQVNPSTLEVEVFDRQGNKLNAQ